MEFAKQARSTTSARNSVLLLPLLTTPITPQASQIVEALRRPNQLPYPHDFSPAAPLYSTPAVTLTNSMNYGKDRTPSTTGLTFFAPLYDRALPLGGILNVEDTAAFPPHVAAMITHTSYGTQTTLLVPQRQEGVVKQPGVLLLPIPN